MVAPNGLTFQAIRNAGQFQAALRTASDPTGPLIMEVCVNGDDYDGLLQGP